MEGAYESTRALVGSYIMQESDLWSLIARTNGDADAVEAALKTLSADEIESFHNLYWTKHNLLHRWDVWGAGYIIAGGMSDDSFHYFKAYVVGKGQTAYEAMLKSPDSFGPFATDDEVENESLNYASQAAYEAVTDGGELPYLSREGSDPSGEPWDEDAVYDLFPNLTAKFG
jgi:hypothetical protein